MTARRIRWALAVTLAVAAIAALILTQPGDSPVPGTLLGIAAFVAAIYALND